MKFLDLKYDAFGLDISDSSVKIAKLEKKRGKFLVASYGQTEMKPGVVVSGIIKNEKVLAETIKSTLNSIKGKKLKTKYAFISLPEEKSFLQVIQMPKMSPEELKSAVIFEAENYIPLPIDQVYLDFQTIAPIEDGLDHIDVLVVATPKQTVDSYVSCVKAAGLIPLSAEVESQSIARALVKNEKSENPLVLIDIGKDTADFIVFSGYSIRFTYSIPLSSDENPDLDELADQIEKYIDFYQEHASHEHLASDGKLKQILLCGTNLKKLPDFFTKKFDVQASLGDPFINLPLVKDNEKKVDFLPFTTALGLALGAINIEKENLSK